jgi:hypothetical protein
MHKTHPVIYGMSRTYSQLFVSDGFNIGISGTDGEKVTRQIYRWMKNCFVDDLSLDSGTQNLVYQMLVKGDVLVYFTSRKDLRDPKKEIPKINIVDADRVRTPPKDTILLDAKNNASILSDAIAYWDNGVAIDNGETLGYAIAPTTKNGKWLFFPRVFGGYFHSVLFRHPIQLGQTTKRGYPVMTPGIETAKAIAEILRDETVSSTLRTRVAFILKIMDTNLLKSHLRATGENADEKIRQYIYEMIAQMNSSDTNVVLQAPGVEIVDRPFKNTINPDLEKVLIPFYRQLANLYGINYAALFQDHRAETGTTNRTSYVMASQFCSQAREHYYNLVLIPFLEVCLLAMGLNTEEYDIRISSRDFGFAKEVEEVAAKAKAVEAGLMTIATAKEELGYNSVIDNVPGAVENE